MKTPYRRKINEKNQISKTSEKQAMKREAEKQRNRETKKLPPKKKKVVTLYNDGQGQAEKGTGRMPWH